MLNVIHWIGWLLDVQLQEINSFDTNEHFFRIYAKLTKSTSGRIFFFSESSSNSVHLGSKTKTKLQIIKDKNKNKKQTGCECDCLYQVCRFKSWNQLESKWKAHYLFSTENDTCHQRSFLNPNPQKITFMFSSWRQFDLPSYQ